MQTNQSEACTPKDGFTWLLGCRNHPRARHQTTRGSPYSSESHKIIQTRPSYTCLLCLAHPLLRKPLERLSCSSPSSAFCLQPISCGPAWHCVPSFLLVTVSNKLSFQCQSSSDPLASPFLNKTTKSTF